MLPDKQLSLVDIFMDYQNKFENDKYYFLALLEHTIDLNEIVSYHIHQQLGEYQPSCFVQ